MSATNRFEKSILPSRQTDDGVQDVSDQRGDDLAEGSADDHADGEIENVAAHNKRLEFFEHVGGSPVRSVYTENMAKNTPLITVTCSCCQAELHIDPETSAVIRYVEHVKPPTFADLESAVERQKGEA